MQEILHSSHLTGSLRPTSLCPRQSDKVSLEASTLRRFGRLTRRCHFLSSNAQFTVPPCYHSWTEVLEKQRARLRSIIEGDRSPNEYQVVCAAIDRLATDRYRDYKLKAHKHLKVHEPNRYGEMSTKDWQKCIDFFTSPTFVDKLVELIETQHTQVASSGTSLDERAIAKEVLGEQRGHVRGVGRVPKDSSPSLDSTAASKAPQGTSHQFSGDPHNNGPQFAIYEAQLRRMQWEIELLINSIPVVVLEEDENGDEDEGLGICRFLEFFIHYFNYLKKNLKQIQIVYSGDIVVAV
ncbi:hypothetical protein Adt_33009 [Abeliophyllum distichum]|uniref:Uncharacterized protein n=1 Tax=Abeliophyllum distichum TaxID=126358 RepID=A0ABD1QV77_9LAMI